MRYVFTPRRPPRRSGIEVKIKEFKFRDKTNAEPGKYDYTSYNWSHCNSNEKLKKVLEAIPGKH
jgi:hypothetical protein